MVITVDNQVMVQLLSGRMLELPRRPRAAEFR